MATRAHNEAHALGQLAATDRQTDLGKVVSCDFLKGKKNEYRTKNQKNITIPEKVQERKK